MGLDLETRSSAPWVSLLRNGAFDGMRLPASGLRRCIEVRRVKIIFPSNADEREQRIGEGRSHSLCRGDIGDRTYGPFRGDPFARRMSQHSGEAKKPGILVDRGGLDCRDLISAKALADNVQAA
jgi:hypothetical protein